MQKASNLLKLLEDLKEKEYKVYGIRISSLGN